jgi:hypothetical protein
MGPPRRDAKNGLAHLKAAAMLRSSACFVATADKNPDLLHISLTWAHFSRQTMLCHLLSVSCMMMMMIDKLLRAHGELAAVLKL